MKGEENRILMGEREMEIVLLFYLVILSIYDCRERKVPTVLLCLGIAVAVILCGMGISNGRIWYQLIGWMPGAFLVLVAFATKKVGYADGLVLVVVGALLGYQRAVFLFCFSLILIVLVSVPLLLLHKFNGKTRIPYLPFITTAFLMQKLGAL